MVCNLVARDLLLETGTEERSMREDQEDEPRGETELLYQLLLEDQSAVVIGHCLAAGPVLEAVDISWHRCSSRSAAAAPKATGRDPKRSRGSKSPKHRCKTEKQEACEVSREESKVSHGRISREDAGDGESEAAA